MRSLLIRHEVDPHRVAGLLSKNADHPHASLFSGPINIDTLEGISRSRTYINPDHVHCHPALLVEASARPDERGLRRIDDFWRLKETVYRSLIFNPKCFAADALCRAYVAANMPDLSAADFFLTETGFIRKYPGFGDFLADLRHRIALKGADAVLRAPPADLTPVPERAFLIRRCAKVATHADLGERYVERKDIIRRRIATLGEKTAPARMGRLDL